MLMTYQPAFFSRTLRKKKARTGQRRAEIRQRAFEIHIERGGIHGCDPDDYLQAERDLQEKYNKSSRE